MDATRRLHAKDWWAPWVLTLLVAGCGGGTPADRAAAPRLVEKPSASPPPSAERLPADSRQPREITFDDIKLEMPKGDPFTRDLLPKRVTALEQERVRIRGYILPSFQQSGLTQFVLVRDNQECCFGPGAALHDCVVVRMQPGRTADFSIRPVAVAGRFKVEELRGPDGKHLAIYALDGESVQ
ncbi:MAG: DUF3299 domain-containing protein [Planctomycetia bacterium]|nr:DUF3299 domain-containing protein [Planctomycetia bacterium]